MKIKSLRLVISWMMICIFVLAIASEALAKNSVASTGNKRTIDINMASSPSEERITVLESDGGIWYSDNGQPLVKGPTIIGAVQIADGNMVLKEDGTVWEWDDETLVATQIPELQSIVDIQSAGNDQLALDKDGVVWAKGTAVSLPITILLDNWSFFDGYLDENVRKMPKFLKGPHSVKAMSISGSGDIALIKNNNIVEHYYGGDFVAHYGKYSYKMPHNLTAKKAMVQDPRYGSRGLLLVMSENGKFYRGFYGGDLELYDIQANKYNDFDARLTVGDNGLQFIVIDHKKNPWLITDVDSSKAVISTKSIPITKLKNVIEIINHNYLNRGIALDSNGQVWQWGKPHQEGDSSSDSPLNANITPTLLQKQINVNWNGKPLDLSSSPVMQNSLMIPMRELFEAFGAKVSYSGGKITVLQGKHRIDLKVYSHSATVDGKKVQMAEAPTYIDGKTYVPLRFIAQSLGATVAWDGDQLLADINYNVQ